MLATIGFRILYSDLNSIYTILDNELLLGFESIVPARTFFSPILLRMFY